MIYTGKYVHIQMHLYADMRVHNFLLQGKKFPHCHLCLVVWHPYLLSGMDGWSPASVAWCLHTQMWLTWTQEITEQIFSLNPSLFALKMALGTLEMELGVFFSRSIKDAKQLRSWCAYLHRSQYFVLLHSLLSYL